MAPSKNIKISEKQKEYMLTFMVQHPDFAMNKIVGPFRRTQSTIMWENLTKQLNATSGTTKNVHKWKTSWSDWKLKIRSKAKALAKGIAPRDSVLTELTPIEKRLIRFLEADEAGLSGTDLAGACLASPKFEQVVEYDHEESFGSDVTAEGPPVEVQMSEGEEEEEEGDGFLVYTVDTEGQHLQRLSRPVAVSPGTRPAKDAMRRYHLRSASTARSPSKRKFPPPSPRSPAERADSIEREKLSVFRQIRGSLDELCHTSSRKATAYERKVAAYERKVAAYEGKVAASERKASALERIAAAKEAKNKMAEL